MEEAGFFPTDRSQVYDVDDGELFLVGTSEVPLSALHRGELLDADALPRALRRVSRRTSGARRAPTARTPAASSASTSSTRSRCSPTRPDRSWDEHERILAIEESHHRRAGAAVPRGQHRRRRPRCGRGEEVRHRGVAAVGGALPRAHSRARTTATSRPAGSARGCGASAAPSWCTRSTAPRARSAARSCSSSSTTSRPTAPSPSPTCSGPSPASTASPPASP